MEARAEALVEVEGVEAVEAVAGDVDSEAEKMVYLGAVVGSEDRRGNSPPLPHRSVLRVSRKFPTGSTRMPNCTRT